MRRLLFPLILITLWSCAPPPAVGPAPVPVIPRPAEAKLTGGSFRFSSSTIIAVADRDSGIALVAGMTADLLRHGTRLPLRVVNGSANLNAIIFRRAADLYSDEAYRLSVTKRAITIEARSGAGAFYALQTLRQMLPPEIESAGGIRDTLSVACAEVVDAPRYPYRGLHLDVARHFFPVSFIKKYLDLMALHKFNRFHWHLTDDQGWRIEIKRFPRLTEVGAWRNATLRGHYNDRPWKFDSTRSGGFYTQEDVREVVRYAQQRFITVIPEIEMPGHAVAALAAYPELSCTGGPFTPGQVWGVFDDVYCTKDSVFTFLEGVLTEVMDLFPSTTIHIGGDEVPKTRWSVCPRCRAVMQREGLKNEQELQSYFTRRIERFLNDHGRRVIGWDEILEGGLPPNATVMSWRGMVGGIEAARQGHDVVMTPESHCYLDYYQSQSPDEPLAIGGYITLARIYSYEPTPPDLTSGEALHILGAQGNVWTEYLSTPEQVEYMVYPRAAALAEVVWSPAALRDNDEFTNRLARHMKRLELLGVNAARHLFDVTPVVDPAERGVLLSLLSRRPGTTIRFTSDGSAPRPTSPRYAGPIAITNDATVRAAGFADTTRVTREILRSFVMHKAAGKPIDLAVPPDPTYGSGGRQALVNGIHASETRYGDGEWLGWAGADLQATIDLLRRDTVRTVEVRFFNGVAQWIWLPRSVMVLASTDGAEYRAVGSTEAFDPTTSERVTTATITLNGVFARYLRIVAHRRGIIPDGNPGAGREAWLFVDELVVR